MKLKLFFTFVVCILVGCTKNADIESVNVPVEPASRTVLPKISKDISTLSADDAIKVANLFSHGSVLTKSETLKDVRNVVPIKDASDRTLMYAVNYDDGYAIVSATKNYHPVLAVVDHGTYTGEKTGTGQDVLMNEYMAATEAAMDGEITIEGNPWSVYEDVTFELLAPTKVSDDYTSVANDYIEEWYMAGYNIYLLRDQPENMSDELYETFCDYARDYDRPDHDYMQCSFIVENDNPRITIVGPLCQTTWDQESPYNSALNYSVPLGCTTIAAGQIMKCLQYPSNISWTLMPNSLSDGQTNATLSTFLANLRCNIYDEQDYANINKVKRALERAYNYDDVYDLSIINHNATQSTTSLQNGIPVYMRGLIPTTDTGHAWVCDGYRSNVYMTTYSLYVIPLGISEISYLTNIYNVDIYQSSTFFFHHNWGWGGQNNGYYVDSNVSTINGVFSSDRKDLIIALKE